MALRVTRAVAAAALVTGCSATSTVPAGDPAAGPVVGEVVVAAAASLTNAFADLAAAFEAEHAGADVVLDVGGTSTLREQILAGAPIDVFAAADTANVELVIDAGLASPPPAVFASNRLQLAVPAGNPAGVSDLSDLGDDKLLVGLCAVEVPCGALAASALHLAGVVPAVDTYEPNVRALLTRLAERELDAGLVYATDAATTDDVDAVELPAAARVESPYAIVALTAAANPRGARAFVEFVLSDTGRAVLDRHGFGAP